MKLLKIGCPWQGHMILLIPSIEPVPFQWRNLSSHTPVSLDFFLDIILNTSPSDIWAMPYESRQPLYPCFLAWIHRLNSESWKESFVVRTWPASEITNLVVGLEGLINPAIEEAPFAFACLQNPLQNNEIKRHHLIQANLFSSILQRCMCRELCLYSWKIF